MLAAFPGEEHLRSLRNSYRQKYAGRTIDMILAGGDHALEFLVLYQEDVWPEWVVFCGINADGLDSVRLGPHITGVARQPDFRGTLALALALQPQTRQVVVLSGTSPTDHYHRTLAERQWREFAGAVELVDLGSLPMQELLDRVARLPEHTIIFALTFFREGAEDPAIPRQAVSQVAQAANAPVYAVSETYLGHGPVGGHMHSYEATGARVAELGARILNGQRPEELPILTTGSNAYLFDWRQLQRWEISADRLPPGSLVRYQELSMWERYRAYIIGSAMLCLVDALLIVALLVQRKRRWAVRAGAAGEPGIEPRGVGVAARPGGRHRQRRQASRRE